MHLNEDYSIFVRMSDWQDAVKISQSASHISPAFWSLLTLTPAFDCTLSSDVIFLVSLFHDGSRFF